MRTILVTGATGLVGRALVARLRAEDVRVLATARTLDAERTVRRLGAEPLHTDLANLGSWRREAEDAEAIVHVGLPRLRPPLRRAGARRRASEAAAGARALHELADGRPVAMLSSGLRYGSRDDAPAVDDDPAAGGIAIARAAAAAEEALAGPALRVVRAPWIHGEGGLMRDLVIALRARRFRIVGPGTNSWGLLSAEDAAEALLTALGSPPGVYSAAEPEIPTQLEVVGAICTVPGHRRPDRAPAGISALALGGAMSEALSASMALRTGRLADHGWAPRRSWREDVERLARSPLPDPDGD